jgi:hypothetical protein
MSAIISIHQQDQPSFYILHKTESLKDRPESAPPCLGNLLIDMLAKYRGENAEQGQWQTPGIATDLLKHKKDGRFALKGAYTTESCTHSYVIDAGKKTMEAFELTENQPGQDGPNYNQLFACCLEDEENRKDCKKLCGKAPKTETKPSVAKTAAKTAKTAAKTTRTAKTASKPAKRAAKPSAAKSTRTAKTARSAKSK